MRKLLPGPTLFSDWKAWASAFLQAFTPGEEEKALRVFSKTALPPAVQEGGLIFVPDEAGGAIVAFSDGTNWRRVTDRAVVS